jgi:hypothetical protein
VSTLTWRVQAEVSSISKEAKINLFDMSYFPSLWIYIYRRDGFR